MNIMLMERPVAESSPPADLIERYLDLGHKGCADHFNVHHSTARRWLNEVLTPELIEQRMAIVRQRQHDGLTRYRLMLRRQANYRSRQAMSRTEARRRAVCASEPKPDAETIRAAAHYLRTPMGGRHVVCPSGHGDWFVGSVRVTPQDLVRRAKAKGFVE